MNCCKSNCTYASIIAGLVAGVLLGILFALGYVSTGVIFWAYLLFGVLGILLSPIYAGASQRGADKCFCRLRTLFFTSAIGAVLLATVGLIVPIVSTVVTAIILGIATAFTVMELVSTLCIANCLCNN